MSGLFRSFLPMQNPLGFGATDYLELAFALLLVLFVVSRPLIAPAAALLAKRTAWCMAALAAAPVILRVALLAHHPVPTPDVYDEFGHLFVADTLRHLRLANPMHPMHRFFETIFILQQPTYSSIYPLGQGMMLAFGRLLFGLPWAGVVASTAALCALSYWMLRPWLSNEPNGAEWALLGGGLAIIEFGPLSGWMNSYWGGALAACAGCLVFGSLPRITSKGRMTRARWRDGVVLGLGLAIHALTRPYESILLLLSVILFFAWERRFPLRPAAIAAAFLAAAGGVTVVQNHSVTGRWLMLPYQLSQYEYGVPAGLTFQPDPTPHRDLTPAQQSEYEAQRAFRNSARETLASYLLRLEYRVRYYRFFFLPALYVAILAYLFAFRSPRWAWVLATLALFAIGSNFFPSFQVHYIAALTPLFLLMSVEGLRQLSAKRWGRPVAMLALTFCAAHFVFWYGLHLFETNDVSAAMRPFESWDSINHDAPTRRLMVKQKLAAIPGPLLVFVRYAPQHRFQQEWVYNEADIDAARIVWARDLGPSEDEQLIRYYPRRSAWLLEPDEDPPKLTPYVPEPPPAISAAQPTTPEAVKERKPEPKHVTQPTLRFENVK